MTVDTKLVGRAYTTYENTKDIDYNANAEAYNEDGELVASKIGNGMWNTRNPLKVIG